MKLNLLSIATASALSVASMASATTVPEPADFVNDWHGVGSDHQANNQPGDTAVDRHNFLDATSGGSGKNPTANSAKRK